VHTKNREQKKNHFFAACPNRPSREKKRKQGYAKGIIL
jgi:hypothetical protein